MTYIIIGIPASKSKGLPEALGLTVTMAAAAGPNATGRARRAARWLVSTDDRGRDYSSFPVMDKSFSSLMAFVIWMSRGHAMVQL